MNLLLWEDLPLRTTRMLGDYTVDAPLAHRYGDLTAARFKCERLTDSTFFVADHPMDVAKLFIGDQETQSWQQETKSDTAGHTWTIANTGTAVDPGLEVSATGTGKRNPRTGALLENPADIAEDVLRLAGRIEDWSSLRAECSAAGLRIAGNVDTIQSIRATLDEITESVGSIWTQGMARLYPVLAVTGLVRELTKMDVDPLSPPTADMQDTADILRLSYDWDSATQKAQHYIELSANPQSYGGVVQELTLKWLRTPANAESVGRRLLARLAGKRYGVQFDSQAKKLRPGQWLRLVAHPAWPFTGPDPVLMPLSAEINGDNNKATVFGEALLSFPAISVTSHSLALSSITQGGIDIAYKNGVATFTFEDTAGNPMKNARVSVDGSQAKTTNDQGVVSFIVAPGQHKIAAEATGFTAISATFKL